MNRRRAGSKSAQPAPARASSARPPGVVRIIGGHWRGTRLPVADRPGLRPTSDRVRETLFNWLQPKLPGARVLDAFAGSGALGLEALSRGAAEAVLIERDHALADTLRTLVARLSGGERARIVEADALRWLAARSDRRFDLVFLDPPFAGAAADGDLWRPALAALRPWLADDAWLYLETPRELAIDPGDDWRPHREGATREVRYALYVRDRGRPIPPAPAADTLPAAPQPEPPDA